MSFYFKQRSMVESLEHRILLALTISPLEPVVGPREWTPLSASGAVGEVFWRATPLGENKEYEGQRGFYNAPDPRSAPKSQGTTVYWGAANTEGRFQITASDTSGQSTSTIVTVPERMFFMSAANRGYAPWTFSGEPGLTVDGIFRPMEELEDSPGSFGVRLPSLSLGKHTITVTGGTWHHPEMPAEPARFNLAGYGGYFENWKYALADGESVTYISMTTSQTEDDDGGGGGGGGDGGEPDSPKQIVWLAAGKSTNFGIRREPGLRVWNFVDGPSLPAAPGVPIESVKVRLEDMFRAAKVDDIQFVTEQPGEGEYMTVYFAQYADGDLLGLAPLDRYNQDRQDFAFVNQYDDLTAHFDGAADEYYAETAAHEIGHALGLMHVDPFPASAIEIMDYDSAPDDREEFTNVVGHIFDKRLLMITHNPEYHLRRYVDGESISELEGTGLAPGAWDTGGPMRFGLGMRLANSAVVHDLLVGLSWSDDTALETLAERETFDVASLDELGLSVPAGAKLVLTASSAPGGPRDIVLTTGRRDVEGASELPEVKHGSQTAFLQRIDSDGRTHTIAEVGLTGEAAEAPVIERLDISPDPVAPDARVTLSARGVADGSGPVASVAFYRDLNANAVGEDNELLGTDDDGSDGWSFELDADWPEGEHDFLAVAADEAGTRGMAALGRAAVGGEAFATLDAKTRMLRVTASDSADVIDVFHDGSSLIITLNGRRSEFASDDVSLVEVFGGDGPDRVTLGLDLAGVRVFAGAGDDTVSGPLGNDEIFGEDGDDVLDGHGGNDSIDGGAGDDYLMGGTGIEYDDARLAASFFDRDTLIGGEGNDTLSGGLDVNLLQGGDGDDLLNGSGSRDTLDGGAGSDRLRGYGNADLLIGGDGTDTVLGDAEDGIRGGSDMSGPDTLEGGDGDDVLFGFFADDLFRGGLGADSLFGGDGEDSTEEEDEDDVLDSVENVL